MACVQAPAVAAKRPQTAAGGGAGKKNKRDPVQKKCASIVSFLEDARGIEPDALLLSMIPFVLATPKDQRHRFQIEAIELIENALMSEVDFLEKEVQEAVAQVQALEEEKTLLESGCNGMTQQLEAGRGEAHACLLALAGDARAYQAAKKGLHDAEAARTAGEIEFNIARDSLGEVQAFADDLEKQHGKPLEDISAWVGKLFRHIDVEDTLKTAAPCALSKEVSARGGFDALVVQQIAEKTSGKIASLKHLRDTQESSAKRHEGAVEAARAAFEDQKSKQIVSASAYKKQAAIVEGLEAAVEENNVLVKALMKKKKNADHAVAEAKEALSIFKDFPLAQFHELQDATTPEAPPESTSMDVDTAA
eukprot:TRINITY_DN57632_c0_g1_i1.p1 TRINITY_DN57632_c0_g1~~TRINITY_DN57632_c0_g1_i1.p1  ORF type:complete len:384 (-),score=107.47 TRINITY_DN57632_c0_g1_i1:289-1380(-)